MNFGKTRGRSRKTSLNICLNTEKWRNYAKRISRKGAEIFAEDSEDDEPRYNEIKDWMEEFFDRRSSSVDGFEQDMEVHLTRKQTIVLSTLVPDEILLMDKFDSLEPKRFVGVLLMADVSGFTALSERYNNTGKGGTYRLTVTLNTYLGSLIELIYSHGGDILKFAGDAFLALWKTDKRSFLCHTIHTVIACALIIQHSYASYETDVKVNLRVKLAIAAGNLIFAPIGSGTDMSYVIFGLPVLEAKAAESVCASGEVKLTPTAWGHCYSRNYDHIVHKDGHVTIKSILYDPRENDVTKPFIGFGALIKQVKRPLSAIENLPDFLFEPMHNLSAAEALKKSDILSLRKTILLAEESNIGSEIRKFMIRPVLTQIDAHQPLEYLTEMRPVSILFMTLKPNECPFLQFITIVNNTYQITCDIVYKSMGCVNKIILFDKDVMILVVFGLRGFKHESEAQAALKCSQTIKKSVSTLDGVTDVSIGVTTGQVYCGVVGHPLRREFTVIGAIVNKAARLMCKFRNKITCDEITFVKSKISSNAFTLQPETELKGIGKVGKIYEYTEDLRVKKLNDILITQPLLGRVDEMEYYQSWLKDHQLPYRNFDALMIVGESRIGKTRLLEWMARYAKNNGYQVCFITLSSIHSSSPYLALSQIINQMLGLKEPILGFIKEERIVQLMNSYTEDLCYLNNIIKVRFAYHEGIYALDETKRKDKAKDTFLKLINAIQETHVVFLDDLQNLDAASWEFLCLTFSCLRIFTVFSLTRGKFSSVQNWLYNVLINNSVRKITLEPLDDSWIPALACQILDVDAVPKDLCNALTSKCNGIPGSVETFITHLFSNGALELKKIQDNERLLWEEEELLFPDRALLQSQALEAKDHDRLDQLMQSRCKEEVGICIVTEKEQLNININVQNLDALIMIQIDTLTPYQQLLLKIASVIGNVLSRDLLENIMYENNWLTTAKGIKRLFAMRILTCANFSGHKMVNKSTSNAGLVKSQTNAPLDLGCECDFDYDPDNYENLPKYALCKVMQFRNKNSRKTCYELLPINQKKEFHSRIVNYLENNKQKCPSCGGTIMVVQSLISFQRDSSYTSYHSTRSAAYRNFSNESEEEIKQEHSEIQKSNYQTENVNKSRSDSLGIDNSKIKVKKSNSDSVNVGLAGRPYNGKNEQQHEPILKTKTSESVSVSLMDRRSTKRVTMTDYKDVKSSNEVLSKIKVFDLLREVAEADNINDWHRLGVIDSKDDLPEPLNRQSLSIKIEKGLSETNFSKCTCADLQVAIYEQLIQHAVHAELKNKTIEFIITYCYLNLLGNNVENVLPKLDNAEKMCNDHKENFNSFDKKRYFGKILALRAAACLISGKLTAAKIELERALQIYKINMDKVTDILRFKNIINSVKFKSKNYRTRVALIKADAVYCLNVATLLYSTLKEDKLSRLAAFRALESVQNVECSVVDICDAYSNAIQVELDRGMADSTADIEKMACLSLRRISNPIKADELYAVGKLYMATFRARLARAQLISAIRSGFRVLSISRFLQADSVSLDILPDLFYVLLSRRRIEEAVDILQLALQLCQSNVSHDSETWYYALCIDMILDAGFQLESPHEISLFAEYALSRGRSGGASRRRLMVGLWTYWLRADSEKKAKIFETEALSWSLSNEDDGSMTSLLSAMRLVDGMLECLARKLDDLKKVVDLMELRSIADTQLNRLEGDARLMRTLYSHWMLLKAYSLKLSGRQAAASNLFNQALEESRRVHNRLEEALAQAASANSIFWAQSARTSNFIHWRAGIEHAHTSWHQLMYRMSTNRS